MCPATIPLVFVSNGLRLLLTLKSPNCHLSIGKCSVAPVQHLLDCSCIYGYVKQTWRRAVSTEFLLSWIDGCISTTDRGGYGSQISECLLFINKQLCSTHFRFNKIHGFVSKWLGRQSMATWEIQEKLSCSSRLSKSRCADVVKGLTKFLLVTVLKDDLQSHFWLHCVQNHFHHYSGKH